jgi:hypothetical protein
MKNIREELAEKMHTIPLSIDVEHKLYMDEILYKNVYINLIDDHATDMINLQTMIRLS